MNEQHELDRLLREKFNSREFNVEEKDWEAARELIELAENQTARRLLPIWKWFVYDLGLVLLLVSFLSIIPDNPFPYPSVEMAEQSEIQPSEKQDKHPHHTFELPTSANSHEEIQSPPQKSNSLFNSNVERRTPQESFSVKIPALSAPQGGNKVLNQKGQANSSQANPGEVKEAKDSDGKELLFKKVKEGEENLYFSDSYKPILTSVQFYDYQLLSLPFAEVRPEKRLTPSNTIFSTKKKHQLSFAAGLQADGVLGNRPEESVKLAPALGLAYTYQLSQKWQITTGIRLLGQASPPVQKSFESIRFGFGKSTETVTLQPQSLYFASLPFQFSYRLSNKQQLLLGWQQNYLFQSRTNVVSVIQDGFGRRQLENDPTWGYRAGFNKWDGGLLIGYRYSLEGKWTVGLEAYRSFFDLTKNSYWNSQQLDYQQQIRLWLNWNIR